MTCMAGVEKILDPSPVLYIIQGCSSSRLTALLTSQDSPNYDQPSNRQTFLHPSFSALAKITKWMFVDVITISQAGFHESKMCNPSPREADNEAMFPDRVHALHALLLYQVGEEAIRALSLILSLPNNKDSRGAVDPTDPQQAPLDSTKIHRALSWATDRTPTSDH